MAGYQNYGMSDKENISLLTWNVRGLGTYQKRYRVFTFLKRNRFQIACLQKTFVRSGGY